MNKTAQFLIIFAAFCWGLNGFWARFFSSAGLSFFEFSEVRSLTAAICIFIILLVSNRAALKIKSKDVWLFIFTGGLGYALCYVCFSYTATKLTLSATTIIVYTSPYMVMVLSAIIFKERITLRKFISLIIAFTGCVMTIGVIDNADLPAIGLMSGAATAFLYSLFTIFSKIAMQKYKPITVTAYSFGVAGIVLLPFCDFNNIVAALGENINLEALLVFGLFFTMLPSLCYLKGLEKLEPSRAAIIAFFEPLTAAAAGIILYNEMLSAIKIAGMALIFLALIVLNRKQLST